MKSRFLRGCINKCKKMGSIVKTCGVCEDFCERGLWSSLHESCSIPSDVPKGHMVVYVGENHKRYVIKIVLLHHPLFKALLDQAQEEYDFIAHSKLCIPCDEHLFLNVVRCAASPQNQRVYLCL
ncbi:indole-3-acetic acid-induced protein ARG7-like [Cicer arietinum]|uniref:Indole-3-acetic acid-induced protein ARG7-like n=1 Tax=Cicer arietinum TaxID=3827 RepID=A0A1S2Y220_CICAR|nr:indole-3-acetic acid-induced protein ARG7-like [Cicer arietinum]